jgi:hypothetical protein
MDLDPNEIARQIGLRPGWNMALWTTPLIPVAHLTERRYRPRPRWMFLAWFPHRQLRAVATAYLRRRWLRRPGTAYDVPSRRVLFFGNAIYAHPAVINEIQKLDTLRRF